MRIGKMIVPAILSAAVILSACGTQKQEETDPVFEQVEPAQDKQDSQDKQDTQTNQIEALSEEQALAAVQKYCEAINPGFDADGNAEGYTEYWDVSTNETGEIVVLYRSYTAAQTRYYIDPESGETYVTELVPGIIDEEQKTGETFNIMEYR